MGFNDVYHVVLCAVCTLDDFIDSPYFIWTMGSNSKFVFAKPRYFWQDGR